MNSVIKSCLSANDPGLRLKKELVTLVPWFRKCGQDILTKLTDEVIVEILQRCKYERFQKDNIIISQGDLGDSFYILIDGQVGIYVKDLDSSNEELKRKKVTFLVKDIRNSLGTCVSIEGEGYSFGEYAVMDPTSVRKASIIVNDDCSVISIDRATYNSCLKNIQKEMLAERENFISSHILLGHFEVNVKDLIKMGLKKISIPFESNLITQGERYSGLIFITRGSANLIVDTRKHVIQYPEFFPLDFTMYDERYKQYPELKPRPVTVNYTTENCRAHFTPTVIRLKRAGDYAALERHIFNQNKGVCTVQSGEIIGDLELLFGLKTNLYTLTCIEKTEAYILDSVHIERIRKRILPNMLFEILKESIRSKLEYRERYFTEVPIPLMLFLKNKLYDRKIKFLKKIPKMKTEKVLPNNEEEWQHLLQMYEKDKAPLFPPCIRGSAFLKDLMKVNAYQRKQVRERELTAKNADFQLPRRSMQSQRLERLERKASLDTKIAFEGHSKEMFQNNEWKSENKTEGLMEEVQTTIPQLGNIQRRQSQYQWNLQIQNYIETNQKAEPKAGAKVYVKLRYCDGLRSAYRLVNHRHNTYRVVIKDDSV